MYRTDKPFMKNPATASSRIYVGNLAETVVPDNLEERFARHGTILGLVLQRGFGFIQFENDGQAQNAIANEHGTIFHNRKINVKQAIDNTKGKPPLQQQQQQQYPNYNNAPRNNPPPLIKDEPAKPNNEPPQRPPSVHQPPPQTGPPPLMQRQLQAPLDAVSPQKKLDEGPPEKRMKRNNMKPPRLQQKRDYRDDYREDMPPPYYEPPVGVPPFNSAYHAPLVDRPERNDCEIIVVSKALTEYAEYIEQRLKTLGLIVDLLFPNEDVPIGRVLANISSRGCLYAILVMPQNEELRSLTLNVLHGIPEEHRNMPIEDAFLLTTRNFEAYMRGEKTGVVGKESDKMTLTMRHPEHIQVILNLLAENRQVSTVQYDKLVTYMQEKRELQSQFEVAKGIDSGAEPEVKNKQAELQNRIMSILNKKADDLPKSTEDPKPPASGPTPLLNDPSVQKALDSLLLGDMFKGLAS